MSNYVQEELRRFAAQVAAEQQAEYDLEEKLRRDDDKIRRMFGRPLSSGESR